MRSSEAISDSRYAFKSPIDWSIPEPRRLLTIPNAEEATFDYLVDTETTDSELYLGETYRDKINIKINVVINPGNKIGDL